MNMKLALAALAMGVSALAFAARTPAALKKLKKQLNPLYLSQPRLSADSRLTLNATAAFVQALAPEQQTILGSACAAWHSPANDSDDDDETPKSRDVIVLWPGGGAFWQCHGGQAALVTSWDDLDVPALGQDQYGRFFVFGGGQFSLGNASSLGLTLSQGSTLFQDRADIAVSESFVSGGGSSVLSLALALRGRQQLTDLIAANLGPQLALTSAGGSTSFVLSGLGGFNFRVFNGSIDVTAMVTTDGAVGMLTGYTVFLNL